MTSLSTLCYIEKDGCYLMLHRTVKKNDVNKDKWIGVGGHFEADESPEECVLREVKEETGYTLTSYQHRGIVTFISGGGVTEYMFLFTADAFTGEPIPCDEGELEWVDQEEVLKLNIWEGDKIFFRLLKEQKEHFSLKLMYDGGDKLTGAVLDGQPMELLDILDRDGHKTGIVRERGVAHRDGSIHGTVHIWVVRERKPSGQGVQAEQDRQGRRDGQDVQAERAGRARQDVQAEQGGQDRRDGQAEQDGQDRQDGQNGWGSSGLCYDVLLQKRSSRKESYPGCFDISAAGHVAAGDQLLDSAVRELKEELGIQAESGQLHFVGSRYGYHEDVFYGRPFRDAEISAVYVYREPVDEKALCLQAEEVETVSWMDLQECVRMVEERTSPTCIYRDELEMLQAYLQ